MAHALSTNTFKSILSVTAAASLALAAVAPQPAQARGRGGAAAGALALGIIGLAAVCSTNPKACGGTARAGTGGPTDAIALDRQQAMWVQEGLAAAGFYHGAIDGAIGPGTRGSIRAYQSAIGAPATGALTGAQINDLVALSSAFRPYIDSDPFGIMFSADLADDLDRNGIAQVQDFLNRHGYGAGAVDGAPGQNTRRAIAAYKADNRLPGAPVATRRLLAYMTGGFPPVPAGRAFAGQEGGQAVAPLAPKPAYEAQPEAEPAVAQLTPMPEEDLSFDLAGLKLGMTEDAAKAALMALHGAGTAFEAIPASEIGGNDRVSRAVLAVSPEWPAPGSEQMLMLFDEARPELGLLAAMRMIHLPDGVDQAMFEEQVLPDIVKRYGTDAMFGNGRLWIGGGAAREQARSDVEKSLECGDLALASVADAADAAGALWSAGGGVRLDTARLDRVKADCGEVLNVAYDGGIIRIGLWNSAALSNGVVVPKIKF